MSQIEMLLARLRELNIKIWLDADQLGVRAPKGVLTKELATELKDNKTQILEYLKQAEVQIQAQATIRIVDRSEPLEASFGQQRLWFLDRLEGPSATYNMPLAIRLTGQVDRVTLQRALDQVVARHEGLRANFKLSDQRLTVVIRPIAQCVIEQRQATQLETLEKEIHEQVERAAQYCFDLTDELLIRATLVSLSDGSTLFTVVMHHIVSDGWSLGIFINELTAGYSNQAAMLPALPIQYADYAAWQRQRLQGPTLEALLDYWRRKLADTPELLNLPTDRPRPAVMSYHGQSIKMALSSQLVESLHRLSNETGSTLFMTMLSAFALLMQRLSGQHDLVIGTTVANRSHADVEPLIGLFINTLALRLDLTDAPSVRTLLERVRQTCLDAYAHQDIPFEQLVEALNPPRSLSYAPLLQVSFDVQNTPTGQLTMPGLELEEVELNVLASKFDLSLSIQENAEQTIAEWTWNPDLFDRDSIERMMGHYRSLLNSLTWDMSSCTADLPLEISTEMSAIRTTEAAFQPYPVATTWLDIFDQTVKQHPEKIAVSFAQHSLTYQELHEQVDALSLALRGLGVGAEVLVAVYLERSIDLVISLLAIMRAGAAYIPLDPGYPSERLAWVLEDAQPLLIITQAKLATTLPGSAAQVICLDRDQETLAVARLRGQTQSSPQIFELNSAYVIFTSGSSGRPKGVQVHHQALLNFLLAMQESPGLTAQDTLLAVTTISFDIAGLEIYLPLMTGAHLVIAPREAALNAEHLQALIQQHGVSHMQATPTTWRLLLDTSWRVQPPFTVMCGGEALPLDLSKKLLQQGVTLWNLYGPTETTIWSANRLIEKNQAQENEGTEPVGAPIRNTQMYVLDSRQNLQPIGVAGELMIGGDGLARGYLNRPDLTADAYRPDQFATQPGSRIYRTGDLARKLANDTYDFLGRIDSQVKIRGYRIELGEIETNLRQIAGVREAVVIAREDTPGDKKLVAYVLAAQSGSLQDNDLRQALRKNLPDYMVPAQVVFLESIPQTPNGKINRKALPAPSKPRATNNRATPSTNSTLENTVLQIWRDVLGREEIALDENFFDLGGHSLLLTRVYEKLSEQVDASFTLVTLFQHPTVRTLSSKLAEATQSAPRMRTLASQSTQPSQEIAIIGMSGRYPGADTLPDFWENLAQGRETIRFYSAEELIAAGVPAGAARATNYVPAHGALSDIESFDAAFFGYTPAEAKIIDPQQRLFLQIAWHALEDAGYAKTKADVAIGVFAGCGQNDYLMNQVIPYLDTHADASDYQAILGNEKDFIATRVSYALNLTGPSINIQTACSTSLVAIHMACRSLIDGECDMALAGGVALKVPQASGHFYQEGMITSPDGHCRAFDAQAQGTVWGSGVGAVLLKPLALALQDQDTIYAVIKGSAINNDGALKVGFTAPSVQGQVDVILKAQERAGVTADSISYVETHGTGTALGDLIEVAALKEAFGTQSTQTQFCALGAVKTNIGHLNSAAGIAGLSKVALALRYKKIPPTVHFDTPNAKLGLELSPFFVSHTLGEWSAGSKPLRAGLSSFGIGGTNAHAILEQAPPLVQPATNNTSQLLVLSARTKPALEDLQQAVAQHLQTHVDLALEDVAWTLAAGRKSFQYRVAFTCTSRVDAIERLIHNQHSATGQLALAKTGQPRVIFMFPGQGSQYLDMASNLYQHEAIFRQHLDACAILLEPLLGLDIRQVLYGVSQHDDPTRSRIDETWLTQPILFAVEYALAQLWISTGVTPNAMIGHSLGEYVAACLAGVFELPAALTLVAERGRLIWALPRGAMLAVPLTELQARLLLNKDLSLAAVNGSEACVISGTIAAIEDLEKTLHQKGIEGRRLQTSHAFHSAMLDAALPAFAQTVRACVRALPTIPFISNVTGTWITAEQAVDAEYWSRHLREAVLFEAGLQTALADNDALLIEVGPGATLSSFVRRHPKGKDTRAVIPSLPKPSVDRQTPTDASTAARLWLDTLAKTWCAGFEIDWALSWPSDRRARVPLPLYPFEKTRHWLDAEASKPLHMATQLQEKRPLDEWFYIPEWQPTLLPHSAHVTNDHATPASWLIFSDQSVLCQTLTAQLIRDGHEVICIWKGEEFQATQPKHFTINPNRHADYARLCETLKTLTLAQVLHCWSLSDAVPEDDFSLYRDGFSSLTNLATAISTTWATTTRLTVLSQPLNDISGRDCVAPLRTSLRGAALAAAQEFSNIEIQCIDIDLTETDAVSTTILQALRAELNVKATDPFVSYRGQRRYVEGFRRVVLADAGLDSTLRIRAQGTYLLTGGLGRMGLAIAGRLATHAQLNLVLLGRTSMPARANWDATLNDAKTTATLKNKIQAIQAIEALGSTVLLLNADVADHASMREALKQIDLHFGSLHGVIHAAGDPSALGFLTDTIAQQDQSHMLSKIQGTRVLHSLVSERELDFCLLMSSTSALLGGLGYAAYSAANNFLDAFADQANRSSAYPWLSVNWDAWHYVGADPVATSEAAFWMSQAEALEAFDRVLAALPRGRLIVASADLETRYKKWVQPQPMTISAPQESQQARPELGSDFAAATTSIEQALCDIWCELLGYQTIGIHDDFFELGGDSMLGIRLIGSVVQRLGHRLPLTVFLEHPTIHKMALAVERKVQGESFNPLVMLQAKGFEPPFFCVPGTGGSVLYFNELAKCLGDMNRPFYGLQALGLDGLARPLARIEDIAALNIQAIQRVQPQGPYFLGGHSFGSWVALEMAKQLQANGQQVAQVVVLDTGIPSSRDLTRVGGWDDSRWLITVAETLGHMFGCALNLSLESLQKLDWNQQVGELAQQLVEHQIIAATEDHALVRGIVEVFKTQATIHYDPPPSPTVPIILLRAQQATAEFLEGMPEHLLNDPAWGWNQYSCQPVSVVFVPGDHLTMMTRPNVTTLAHCLNQTLTEGVTLGLPS
ncbi:MAG: amino acid adenylation domain-containing protein [Candidatus Methylopumilus sp.]|nr:amino acid adenylation domain-containing protein [Candidatus Methylopumilus sp.]